MYMAEFPTKQTSLEGNTRYETETEQNELKHCIIYY